MKIHSFLLMCNWRHGYFKRQIFCPQESREVRRNDSTLAAGIKTLWDVGNALGQDSFSYWYFLWTLKDTAWSDAAGYDLSYSFVLMKSVTPFLVRVYEILDYFHYRRKDRKNKWFNFSLEWRPREVWRRLFVQIDVVVRNLLLTLLYMVN